MVHHIQVHKDKNLKKELKALAELQDIDEKLAVIKNRVTKGQPTDQTQFVLQDNVLHCRVEKTERSYKAMLQQRADFFLNSSILHKDIQVLENAWKKLNTCFMSEIWGGNSESLLLTVMCVDDVSILTGHSQLKRDIIYLRN